MEQMYFTDTGQLGSLGKSKGRETTKTLVIFCDIDKWLR